MNRPFLCVALLFVAIVSVGMNSPVLADTISGPFTTSTPIPFTLTDWTGSLTFPKFDSSLGILTQVDMSLSGGIQTVLTVTNTSPEVSSGTARTEVQMTIQDAGGNLNTPQLDLLSPNYTYSLGSGQSVTSGTLTKSGNSNDSYTLAAVLAEFTGPGTIVLPASTFTQTWLTNLGGSTYASQATSASLTGTVTYHYTTVATPEPTSLLLLAVGLGALGLVSRRKK
jgi:hypothetical protein